MRRENDKKLICHTIPRTLKNEILIRRSKFPINQSADERERLVAERFKRLTGKSLDFSNVTTYNEKIQWIKLYYDHPDLSKIVCKYNFKKYIKKKLGDGYTVPLYGAWTDERRIDFNKLPNSFVLKSNCSGNGNFIKVIRDKSKIDVKALRKELKDWLNPAKLLINTHCRAYWKVKPMILAEKYVEQLGGQVYDYKFFCFGGEPKFAYVATDHFEEGKNIENYKISIYSLDWKQLDVQYGEHPHNDVPAPKNLDKMLELAKKVSKDFPFVRVDFFEIGDKVYFSELTFYPGGGVHKIKPDSVNEEWGSYIKLPEKKAKVKVCRRWFK